MRLELLLLGRARQARRGQVSVPGECSAAKLGASMCHLPWRGQQATLSPMAEAGAEPPGPRAREQELAAPAGPPRQRGSIPGRAEAPWERQAGSTGGGVSHRPQGAEAYGSPAVPGWHA